MEHATKLFDEYLQYIIIGSAGLVAIAAGFNGSRRIRVGLGNYFAELLQLKEPGGYFYLALFLLGALGLGLLMDALSYRTFQVAHIQLIDAIENGQVDPSISFSTYTLPVTTILGFSRNSEQEYQSYVKHLKKQVGLKMNKQKEYQKLFDTLNKSIVISQGVIIACVIYFIAAVTTFVRLVASSLVRKKDNSENNGSEPNKGLVKRLILVTTFTSIVYAVTFQTYWSLETRYHLTAIAAHDVSSQDKSSTDKPICLKKACLTTC